MSSNSSSAIEKYSKDFEKTNHEVRAHWQMGREAARNVAIKLNELVSILNKEHPDWSIKQIAYTIWSANGDLEGFSKDTIYRNLDDDNRALLDVTKQNREKSQNNVLEESVLTQEHNVLEDSSSRTLPTAYDVKEAETNPVIDEEQEENEYIEEEEEDTTFDKAFVDRLIKENAELVKQFTFEYDLEVKDQVLPLKVIVYPDKKTGVVRLRKK